MPAQGRFPAPSLPPVDDEATVPFSDLFKSGFDPATVDATTQLADRSIFVTSNGRRYRFESVPDPAPAYGRVPTSTPPVSSPPSYLPTPRLHVNLSDNAIGWGRGPASASSLSPGAHPAQPEYVGAAVRGSEPTGPAHEVTSMMTHLSIDHFGATPLYGESDGGVQAAETLTDPDVGPRTQMSSASPDGLSTSPTTHYMQQQQQRRRPPPPDYVSAEADYGYVSPGAAPQYWTDVNYAKYTAQTNAHLQNSRQMAVAVTGLPSLMEDSTPITFSYTDSDPASTFSPTSPDREVWDGQGSGNGYPYPPLHASVSAPPSFMGRQTTYLHVATNEIDTLTPVVVHDHAPSTFSDGASTGRDNVLPGEDLVFDGPVKSAQTLTAPVFRDGLLKVFRNTLTNDLRFYCRVDRESETYWMKASNAQLVPAYAYDQRLSNVVYIRDKESDKGSGYMQALQGNCRPSGIYQFSTLKELFDFQAKLTGEKVVLDIGSVRMVTLSRANSRSSTQYSSARLQIWHELEGRRSAQSDVASFVTAGTALSGPLRERLVASSSRLMLYLGRTGEFITAFITDDLEIKAEGQTVVKLKPRKGPLPFSRKGSRWPWVKAHLEPKHGSEPAGLDIHGRAVDVDVGSDYDSYKTFEIEFENSPSQDNFIRKWDEVMRERRLQRARLNHIQEDMESAVFTGRQARGVFM
ncbi:hypothetical protein C8A03DRAFT_43698 [Achaetomium macrosporum]|uniref:Uncharacterized protein n=1 Tax=Achaetomium macrosporum TaxID=79813 RepID=A0AAN7CC10_9PEZI|nr:hypothetical protein C8A03DRAFT_43698 [Achaetomium macrosporum]